MFWLRNKKGLFLDSWILIKKIGWLLLEVEGGMRYMRKKIILVFRYVIFSKESHRETLIKEKEMAALKLWNFTCFEEKI